MIRSPALGEADRGSAQASSRQILRATSIVGGASVLRILIGLVRTKAVALLLGPSGVGLVGLFNATLMVAETVAGLGLQTSGVHRIAASQQDPHALARVRRALLLANLALGVIGGGLLFAARRPIAELVLGDQSRTFEIGLLGLGVFLALLAGSQGALLQGMRRMGDLARVKVFSILLATLTGVPILMVFGEEGLIWHVLLGPAMTALVGAHYASRLPRSDRATSLSALRPEWIAMVRFGSAFMLGVLANYLTALVIRSIVARELGLEAAGMFHAAWLISGQYVGLVLGAMAADYFPRLSAIIDDRAAAARLVNEQAEIALLLAGPMILGMAALAPWVMTLLYSAEFEAAAALLRWQALGNVLMLPSWAVGFILLARARGDLFLATELVTNVVMVIVTGLLLPTVGILAPAIAFSLSRLAYLIVTSVVAARVHGFHWGSTVVGVTGVLLACSAMVVTLSAAMSAIMVALICTPVAAAFAAYSLLRLIRKTSGEQLSLDHIIRQIRKGRMGR